MENEQYAVPTPTGRAIGKALVVIGILLLLLVKPVSDWYVHLFANIRDVEDSRRLLIISTTIPSLIFATLTSWLLGIGHRTISSGHWPPHGLPILYRTRIHNGRQAVIDGMVCLLASGLTGLLAVFWFYMTWKSYNMPLMS